MKLFKKAFLSVLFTVFLNGMVLVPAYSQSESDDADGTEQAAQSSGDFSTGSVVPEYSEIGSWVVNCTTDRESKETVCSMIQPIFDEIGETQAAIIEIFAAGNQNPLIGANAQLVTPLGTNLEQGIFLQVDDIRPQRNYRINYCLQSGCVARMAFFNSEVEEMKNGTQMIMTLFAFNSDQPLGYQISLDGFTRSFEILQNPQLIREQ
ncbi:MAG: invasion associated locus B family protein [Rhodobacteraceae bacterium]|nr:invasion associated locus B family protein [Paracoccaceae bacterium]MCY4250154.1 invasion associated locus B family protein [Paracoccaceae bacterium]